VVFGIALMELIFLNELKRLSKLQDFCRKCDKCQVSISADLLSGGVFFAISPWLGDSASSTAVFYREC